MHKGGIVQEMWVNVRIVNGFRSNSSTTVMVAYGFPTLVSSSPLANDIIREGII